MTTSLKPLYDLAPEYAALEAELHEAGGEMSPELMARFDASADALDAKLRSCALMVRNLDAEAAKHAEEGKRQQNRAATLTRAATSLKAYIAYCLNMAGLKKMPGAASLRTNGGAPSVTFKGDPKDLPEGFRTVIYGYDREAILKAYAAQEPLPAGVTVERGQHVHLDV